MTQNKSLKKTLTPFMLWGLGVGYVISGMYFGWNLGLEKGGTGGMALATLVIMIMYITFTFSYAELACAIPKAGGVFDYAGKAMGRNWGFIAGIAQVVEFILAPPAIAFAIGAYFNAFMPQVPILGSAIFIYLIFTGLNIYGVKAAASFEVIVTILAVGELLLFSGLTLPSFKAENLTHHALPNGWQGAFAAIPFAIWFFLGIEGIANVAEETKNPQKDISKGFGWAIFTLAILCILIFVSATGIAGWETIVYKNGSSGETSDSPLPLALARVTGPDHPMYHLLITVGLFGLVASFHGLILAAGRSTYEMGRVQNLPAVLGRISPRFHTPANALAANMVIGILALLSGKTAEIIILSVFGALTLYIFSMISLLLLRKKEPGLHRPFRVALYPLFPLLALGIAIISIVAMFIFNLYLGIIYFSILLISFLLYLIIKPGQV
ncbi:ethanolamine permease [Chitinophaga terrae (ex Kim and Jung 2007)]|uniref:Ethanolamine permease n=1 Tax=Chitinophaga terrae (ex Kim and Jung 2007) TaxID=408074 RepID=A0A1H4G1I4_9BACT|nr:ethanolamine permease [Chitinophaga terrae (ex Kim and Jung 2007)]SEB02602.1 ethanolamine permease [Chitinophaga terrae (ex Kim and Jung 2007)]